VLGPLSEFLEAEQEAESWADFSAIERIGDDVEILLNVGFDSGSVSTWKVTCGGARDFWLVHGIDIRIHAEDHPAARQYTDDQVDLFFRGTCKDASRVVGKLWHAHRNEVQHWIGFDRYLNVVPSLAGLLSGEYGKLATGPLFLVERYAEVLDQERLAPSIVGAHPAMRLRDGKWVPQTDMLYFVQLGPCCVIAERFDSRRVDATKPRPRPERQTR
jgi:hypothetical protein